MQFRAPVVPTGPPPATLNIKNMPHPGLQATMEKRFRNMKVNGPPIAQQQMNQPPPVSIQNNNRPQQPVPSQSQQSPLGAQGHASNTERSDSVASSLTSTIPPTPTNLLSPNPGGIQMQPMPFNPMVGGVPGPMPMVQNPQTMYPFMAPFPGFAMPTMPEIPADSIKDALCKQIEYYFSAENLQKDFFLRR